VLGISFLSALTFMRIIERPNRMMFFLVGGILYVWACTPRSSTRAC
jgi:hypothetical protein